MGTLSGTGVTPVQAVPMLATSLIVMIYPNGMIVMATKSILDIHRYISFEEDQNMKNS